MSEPQETTPTLTVCGSTGAGKSSLVNALVRAHIEEVGVCPTTRQSSRHQAKIGSGIPVYILDTPGLSEANLHQQYTEKLLELVPASDLLLWVVGYDNRALDHDLAVLMDVRKAAPDLPLLVLGSGIDRCARNFSPKAFDPIRGENTSEVAVRNWHSYLKETFSRTEPKDVLICSAGESHDDFRHQYNLVQVSHRIEEILPEAMRMRWLADEKADNNRQDKARKMILGATAAAGTVGLLPLPTADMPFIVSIQVALIVSLSTLYGRAFSADTARSLSFCALSAVAGPLAFQALAKLLPGLGSVIGAGVASACTYAVGYVSRNMLEGDLDFTLAEFRRQVKEVFIRYRKGQRGEKE